MKYIRKGCAAPRYRAWRTRVAGTQKEDYREIPSDLREILLQCLVEEQGWVCAYTMKRIDTENSHVEHIKPETLCREDCRGSDLDYENIVACFPLDGMPSEYRYGAQQKGDWWENGGVQFVSPLHPACERRFKFDLDGKIEAVNEATAAETTIRVLGLDHPTLTEDRRRVIREFIFGENGNDPLSGAQAQRAIANICRADRRGWFLEFCVAIRSALEFHRRALSRLARRRYFARRQASSRR